MFACGGLGLYFHGQEGLAAIFSLFAAILEKFKFLVLGPLVGPLCSGLARGHRIFLADLSKNAVLNRKIAALLHNNN